MKTVSLLLAIFLLSACRKDETISKEVILLCDPVTSKAYSHRAVGGNASVVTKAPSLNSFCEK